MSKNIEITEQQLEFLMDFINESENLNFEDFANARLGGATKITENAKKKGGPSMLTYYHFNVKLPYYKKASEGKLDIEKSKKEFKKYLAELCNLTDDVEMGQIKFQKLVGLIEVLGELIIKNNIYR